MGPEAWARGRPSFSVRPSSQYVTSLVKGDSLQALAQLVQKAFEAAAADVEVDYPDHFLSWSTICGNTVPDGSPLT
jgi:hypothetical protein